MSFPSPENPANAPVWENYIVAQAVQASLGQLPEHSLAVGVVVEGTDVELRFQLTEVSEQDLDDMAEILDEFESLVGPGVSADVSREVRVQRSISPHDGVRWIFVKRV